MLSVYFWVPMGDVVNKPNLFPLNELICAAGLFINAFLCELTDTLGQYHYVGLFSVAAQIIDTVGNDDCST